MAYEAMGEIEKMETDLRNILKVDYENTNTLNALGYINNSYRQIHRGFRYDKRAYSQIQGISNYR